jgi:glucose-6-phosphate isomerase
MQLLLRLAEETKVAEKIEAMFAGQHLNTTEDRAVLHVALRSAKTDTFYDEGRNVVPDVHAVLDKIRIFSEAVRSGTYTGSTGKPLTEVVCIGIGGSFLGPAFVHTALETDPKAQVSAAGRTLSFLANVDPEDVSRALKGKNPETTLVIVVSKTFTTAETMLNARTVREWIIESLGPEAVSKHMVAVSTNLDAVAKFGLDPNNSFGFWDWVGGRYSVTSAVGILPLAMQYGYPQMERFLAGARSMDRHFASAPLKDNLPVLMGLLGVWNTTFLGCASSAVLPYCQALSKLAPHIQQVSMESNGKGVALDGTPLDFEAGEIIFGEPGTNGQHSFYQLIHQGRIVPAEFVGAALGQQAVYLDGEVVSNHDELMSNFFAQADALAYGKTAAELTAEGVPPALVPHKTFSGNRPSLSLLLPSIGAYQVGQILSLYENKIAAQGFVWGINSFDQWGVELGKVLAGKVRTTLSSVRKDKKPMEQVLPAAGFNYSTTRMLTEYLGHIQTQREGIAYSVRAPCVMDVAPLRMRVLTCSHSASAGCVQVALRRLLLQRRELRGLPGRLG